MEKEIVNRVALSPLVTLDLEEIYPQAERVLIDIAPQLYEGLILKEKDFRAFVKAEDWTKYEGKFVALTCSTDAIIPTWAYMLLASALAPYAQKVHFGSLESLEVSIFQELIEGIDLETYRDKKVVIKGCSKHPVPVSAYVSLTYQLQPIVASLMYGEPCSTVPIYKRPKSAK